MQLLANISNLALLKDSSEYRPGLHGSAVFLLFLPSLTVQECKSEVELNSVSGCP